MPSSAWPPGAWGLQESAPIAVTVASSPVDIELGMHVELELGRFLSFTSMNKYPSPVKFQQDNDTIMTEAILISMGAMITTKKMQDICERQNDFAMNMTCHDSIKNCCTPFEKKYILKDKSRKKHKKNRVGKNNKAGLINIALTAKSRRL